MSFINPYRFGASTAASAIASVTSFDGGTSDTTLSASDSNVFDGATPDIVLMFGVDHDPAHDPGETVDAGFSIGAAEGGTTPHYMVTWSQSDLASTNVSRSAFDSINVTLAQEYPDRSTQVNVSGFVANGCNLDYNWISGTGSRFATMMFKSGDKLTVDLGTGTSAISVNHGLEPQAVIFFGNAGPMGTGGASVLGYTLGFALADGTQRCVMATELDNQAAGQPHQAISTAYCAGQMNGASPTLFYGVTASNFGATGYDVTPTSSAGNDDLCAIALNGFSNVALLDFDTPTSTGLDTITGAGFTPTYAIFVLTNLEATDDYTGSSDDLHSGLGVSFVNSTDQIAFANRINSGADPTDTASYAEDGIALLGPSATDCQAIKATLDAFTSDGVRLNYSAVQGTAKKGFVLLLA